MCINEYFCSFFLVTSVPMASPRFPRATSLSAFLCVRRVCVCVNHPINSRQIVPLLWPLRDAPRAAASSHSALSAKVSATCTHVRGGIFGVQKVFDIIYVSHIANHVQCVIIARRRALLISLREKRKIATASETETDIRSHATQTLKGGRQKCLELRR